MSPPLAGTLVVDGGVWPRTSATTTSVRNATLNRNLMCVTTLLGYQLPATSHQPPATSPQGFPATPPLPLAPGADPPMKTFFPSRYSTKTPTPLLSPLLAW